MGSRRSLLVRGRILERESATQFLNIPSANPRVRKYHRQQTNAPQGLVIITVTMPALTFISVFVAIVAAMMLLPLRFPLFMFEFFVHPYSASIRRRRRLQIRHVLGRQPERVECGCVELAGRRNSRVQLERAHCERCATPVSAVNSASIISAAPQLTLHFRHNAHVRLSRR